MLVAPFKVVLDANVLYPFTLRDTLLRAAAADLFQVYWSQEILEETHRSLLKSAGLKHEQVGRLVRTMNQAFPEAIIAGYEPLVSAMKNDDLPDGIEAQSPDEFLCNLVDLDAGGIVELLREQAMALKRPAHTFDELLDGLAKSVPAFVAVVRAHLARSPNLPSSPK
jgi:hypothetical protein